MADPSHLQKIRQLSASEWNQWRRDNPLVRPDLTEANLATAHLAGANLTRADLAGANLRGANLAGATLIRANLTGADLTRANLARANLTRADLTWANLTGATLVEARWDPALPPTWPKGFDPPANAWPGRHDDDLELDPVRAISTIEYRPVRVESLDGDHLGELLAGLEPLMGWIRNQLHDDKFPAAAVPQIEHVLGSLHRELYDNPGDRNPGVLVAHFGDLVRHIGPYLPAEMHKEGGAAIDEKATREVVEHAGRLGDPDPDADTAAAATTADTLAEAAPIQPDRPDESAESTRRRSIDRVADVLTWGTAGAFGGSQGIPGLIAGFSPVWAAVIGGIAAVLANLYQATRQPDSDG